MKYDLIFYISKKTGYCEKRLKRIMGAIEAEPRRIISATSPETLGEEVSRGLKVCPIVIIIGGLRSPDDDNLATVLSRVLSNSTLTLDNTRKITSDKGSQGYVIRCKNQMLLALPDDPDEIESIISPDLLRYIKEKIAAEN